MYLDAGKINMVRQNIVANGEEIYCYDQDRQLTFRCKVRRMVTVAPNSETIIPVHPAKPPPVLIQKQRSTLRVKNFWTLYRQSPARKGSVCG